MKHRIRMCRLCKQYTLKDKCPICKSETYDPHPPKFSLDDKYIRYRIMDAYADNSEKGRI